MNGLTQDVFDDGEFEKYDRFTSEDLTKGNLKNGCQFEMSEILTERKLGSSNGKDTYQKIYNGLLAKVEIPKPFENYLYLRKDIKEQNFFVRILSGKLPFDELRVKVEPEEFEKLFDIYSSDKDVDDKLFTEEVKQLLMKFQKEMQMNFEITMKENSMYVRYWCGKMFEVAELKKHSLDKDTLYRYYRMLDFVFNLTNTLLDILDEI